MSHYFLIFNFYDKTLNFTLDKILLIQYAPILKIISTSWIFTLELTR